MQWTMPHRVLQIVASLIVLAAVSSFALGVVNAPQHGGRLPGEKVPGVAAGGAAIDAQDATPLSNERIEGPPPPAANAQAQDDESQTEADAGNSDEQESAAASASAPQAPPPKIIAPLGEPPSQTLGGPPAADEPPH